MSDVNSPDADRQAHYENEAGKTAVESEAVKPAATTEATNTAAPAAAKPKASSPAKPKPAPPASADEDRLSHYEALASKPAKAKKKSRKKKKGKKGAKAAVITAASFASLPFLERAMKLATTDVPISESDMKSLRKEADEFSEGKSDDDAELKSLNEHLETLRGRRTRQLENRDKSVEIIEQSLNELDTAVTDGNLKDAQSLEQKIISRFERVKIDLSSDKISALRTRIDSFKPRLRELRDWRNWSTGQAREKLIAEIELLANSKQQPPQIAAEIRRARETWQGWDKGGDSAPRELWERFDESCTRAYEPCKAWFENQSAERAVNLERREAVCVKAEKLAADTDWDNPDWRETDKAFRNVLGEWRKAGPVDRKKRKSIDQRFDAALAGIKEPLDVERKRCLKMREDLIVKVKELANEEDNRKAVDQVREAQTAWRPTVLAHHRVERKLWAEFKTACDAIYDRRRESFKARDASYAANLEAKDEVIKRIEALAEGDEEAILNSSATLNKMRSEYAEAGYVDRKQMSRVEKRFKDAVKKVEKRVSGVKRQQQQAQQRQLDQMASLCASAEAIAAGGSGDIATIKADWQKSELPDSKIAKALTKRFELASKAAEGDGAASKELEGAFSKNQTERERLCLELEIRAEIDSPGEFAAERMQMQVDRLAAAMGKSKSQSKSGAKDTDNIATLKTDALLERWWSTGPVAPDASQTLQTRFDAIKQALDKRS